MSWAGNFFLFLLVTWDGVFNALAELVLQDVSDVATTAATSVLPSCSYKEGLKNVLVAFLDDPDHKQIVEDLWSMLKFSVNGESILADANICLGDYGKRQNSIKDGVHFCRIFCPPPVR
jgi:hypothetical protein